MIEKALFGRTGHESTRAVFGGAALSKATQEQADQALELLLRYGINHLDVAAGYGDAELRVAPWLRQHPGRFFLATKTGLRTYDDAKRQIHQSLERLGVERFDLIQLHSLADPIEWDTALSPKGALEACIEARDQGLVRFIGVTGHGTQIAATHFRSLERFDFDSVLMPYSYIMMQNSYYADAFERLATVCQGKKRCHADDQIVARSPWWGRERTRTTWYEPFSEQDEIRNLAYRRALGRSPRSTRSSRREARSQETVIGDWRLVTGVNPAANSRNHRVRGKAPPLPSRALAQRLLALP